MAVDDIAGVVGRHREPAHPFPAQPKNPSRFPLALAIIENKLLCRRVNFHDKNPFGSLRPEDKGKPYHWLDFNPLRPQIAAAQVEDFVAAAH